MTAFTEERLQRLRAAGDTSPEFAVLAPRGDVSVTLSGSKDAVAVHVTAGAVAVERGAADTRVTLRADDAAWDAYFTRGGGVESNRLLLMMLGGPASDGVLPTPMEVEGDPLALFAHGRTINALLETGRDR
jgi:hypothetical protein